ncbi:hypothetical protein AGRA3207_007338 [Actinomadura graeca]|uniref:Uncharacterized protein n=1 Tax=Actinomadura graeca TaxID=2750812 RepID=A0ABX8R4M4_9ACTN|nr:hypothetical protein [Actinomadura graeca]QXJ25788.1 hypothetical protein AGRA3207_007338 [Actinomadura graeca]
MPDDNDPAPTPAQAPGPAPVKPYQLYQDALWAAGPQQLSITELAVALCYAAHAHQFPYDRAWLTDRRLMQQCKIRSAGTVGRVRRSLVAKGWLTPLQPDTGMPLTPAQAQALRHQRKTVPYLLTCPATPITAAPPDTTPATAAHAAHTAQPAPADPHAMATSPGATAISAADTRRDTPPSRPGRTHDPSPPAPHPPQPATAISGADNPGNNDELAALTTQLMNAYHATGQEVRAVLHEAARDGIRNPVAWMNSNAGHQDFARRLAARRRHHTPHHSPAASSNPPQVTITDCPWCDHHGHIDHGDFVRKCDHTTPPALPPAGPGDPRSATEILNELRRKWHP